MSDNKNRSISIGLIEVIMVIFGAIMAISISESTSYDHDVLYAILAGFVSLVLVTKYYLLS